MKSKAAKAQIESEEVAALNVRKTGESDIKTRNIMMDDLRVLR